MAYEPRKCNVPIVEAAMEHVESVSYKVGLRWVFYRLLQDGYYTRKEDYNRWKSLCSKVRKEFYGGWEPDTLIDEGRSISTSYSPLTAVEMLELLPGYITIRDSIFGQAEEIPFLIYESATSDGQFEHLAPYFDRAALRGDASIPHKWEIAQRIARLSVTYNLPVRILYFGDYDEKGLEIPENMLADVEPWCDCEFEYTRVGITPEQAELYGVPPKDGKETYEWEALDADAAKEVIQGAINGCLDLDAVNDIVDGNDENIQILSDEVKDALAPLVEKYEEDQ